jgi:hypothetical protein
MCPQLVDFNADGHQDLVVGTFEGVAFLVPGSANGFKSPERILDNKGRHILLSAFWNKETNKWDSTDRSAKGASNPGDHCISVAAVDWDADGDLDLLLGAKEGRLYLQKNDGKKRALAFTGYNEPLRAGSSEFEVPGGLTAPRIIDWNGDGRFDLVCGSFDSGVYLFENRGSKRKPKFADPKTLIPPSDQQRWVNAENADLPTEPQRPTSGAYVDAVDYDHDDDLDLLVGGHSVWKPQARKLTPVEQKCVDELLAEEQTVSAELAKLGDKQRTEAEDDAFARLYWKKDELNEQICEYLPRARGADFVWLYRRQ